MSFKKLQIPQYPPRHWVLVGFPGSGKAQPVSSLVKIPGGWKPVGEVKTGDVICSPDGERSTVTGIFPQGVKPVYCVTFVDGRTVRATGDHLWKVASKYWREPRVITTGEIARLLSMTGSYGNRLYVPLLKGEIGMKAELPIDPYTLGVLLGDGGLSDGHAQFTCPDVEIAANVEQRLSVGYKLTHIPDHLRYSIVQTSGARQKGFAGPTPNRYMEILKHMGLSGLRSYEKFIPEIYLEASFEQRLELLRGLMDTDGTAGRGKTVSFSTSSPILAKDVQKLIWSLGGLCHIGTKMPVYTHNGEKRTGRKAYILSIRYRSPGSLFKLERKRGRALPTQYSNRLKLRIVSVEPDGVEECQCIRVSHPSQLYITDNYVVTHNSTFSTQMHYPLLPVDADHRFEEVAHLASGDVYQLSDNKADSVDPETIYKLLNANMPGTKVGTIVVDSLTTIITPLVVQAVMDNDAGRNRNRMAAFKDKAMAMRMLQDAVTKWGTDVLWIYHLQEGRDESARQVIRATLSATERARLYRSINLELHIEESPDKKRRGVRVVWARRGRAGMILWDDSGKWAGMPEKIEQAVYGGLSIEEQQKIEQEAPAVFPTEEAAIEYGQTQGAFTALQHAKNAFNKLKAANPGLSLAELSLFWVEDVEERLAVKAAQEARPEAEQPGDGQPTDQALEDEFLFGMFCDRAAGQISFFQDAGDQAGAELAEHFRWLGLVYDSEREGDLLEVIRAHVESIPAFTKFEELLYQLNKDFGLSEGEAKSKLKELGFTSFPKDGNGAARDRSRRMYWAVKMTQPAKAEAEPEEEAF